MNARSERNITRARRTVEVHSRLERRGGLSQGLPVLDLAPMQNLVLHVGFLIAEIRLTSQFLLDPLGRPAAAQTVIRGSRFYVSLRDDLSETQLSVSLYHEVLEAATLAAEHPPESVMEFNEGDFERAARSAHVRLGVASAARLNQMRAEFGFQD